MTATNLTTPTSSVAAGGRAASIARRLALSAGKSALPPAAERVRNGERSAALPAAVATGSRAASPTAGSAPAHAAPAAATNILHLSSAAAHPSAAPGAAALGANASAVAARAGLSGRLLSMERRRLLAAGKQALRAVQAAPPARPAAANTGPAADANPAAAAKDAECEHSSCRQLARARRAMLSAQGRGCAPAAAPSRPARAGRLQYAPKVVESTTQGRQSVTGSRIGLGSQVTGFDAGATLPVSGTQYIGSEGGTAVRSGGPKVGFARTARGGVVSGTLIRSGVPITGDEAGSTVTITGEAEQRAEDDLTERGGDRGYVAAQFQRQADPHGHSVFGSKLGRSAGPIGSRERRREAPLESTERGLAITGSAVGRTSRVTGDEDGTCRHVTGDQYLSPARAQAECGGTGGGTAPTGQVGARRDPVTGGKVSTAATWGQQRITGTDIEHNPRVTGDAPGSCSLITGTPYQGPHTMHGWCDPEAAQEAEQRLPRQPAASPVTGDTPRNGPGMTGMARGLARSITGTPYYRDGGATAPADDPVAALDEGFSVRSPQRAAHLKADRAAVDGALAASRITGSFALGGQKITGNLEFAFKPRLAASTEAKPAHTRVTGEGRTTGSRISGDPWAARKNVTGTEGFTAIARNASERNGNPQTGAAAGRFKTPGVKVQKSEDKQLVTGMFGWSSKDSAKVTLSGGALG
jgi:hypothetical protein